MIRRLGVGGRLLLAFLGISAFALIAAIAAIYSFSGVGGALRRVTEESMPAALASQELSRQAERVVAAAPALVAALTEQERSEVAHGIDAEIGSLVTRLEELRRLQVDAVTLVEIEPAINNLQANLSALKDLTAARFVNRARRAQLLRELGVANAAGQRLVAASVPLMAINVDEWRRMMDAAPAGAELDREALSKLAEDIAGAVQQQKIQIELTAVNNLLTQAASAERLDDLRLFGFPLRRSFFALEALASNIAEQLSTPLATQVEELKALFEGPRSILDARIEELEIITRAERLLAENITLSRNLTEAANNLVASARRDIAGASADAAAVQRVGTAVLVGVVALSLISSGLIVWLYVGRNLVARLTTLSGSMLAIVADYPRHPRMRAGCSQNGGRAHCAPKTIYSSTQNLVG